MLSRRSLFGFAPALPLALPLLMQPDAADRLASAVIELERGRLVKEGLPTSVCQTGEPYLTFVAGGLKAEGEPFVGYCHSADEAIGLWLSTALLYARERSGFLYWRERPFAEENECGWQVYSRFVISAAPEKYRDADAANDDQQWSYRAREAVRERFYVQQYNQRNKT